ncbi:MAG TPA: amidohydrolase, partial [Rugosimonospora sp.]|nr:amidohydrolase [Rugosimonospora sp.]
MRAETVFVGGRTFLTDPLPGVGRPAGGAPSAVGVAVRAGRIVAVAPDEQLRDLVGPGTEVVDLAGGLLVPGFVDAHAHPVFAGAQLLGCSLERAADPESYVDAVRDYATTHPERAWITGGGWSMEAFPGGTPTRALLDAVVPDRPVYLPNRDYHGAWVNSVALRLAGIDRTTPDPADGRIEREAGGEPTGMLHEGAATLVARLVPEPTAADEDAAFDLAQRHLFALGVTGWQDAIVGDYLGQRDPYETYLRAAADGRLRARVVGALWWDRARGPEQVPALRARRERANAEGAGRFVAGTVKIMQDGVAENFTAAMTVPYRDARGRATGNAGLSFVDPALLAEAVTVLDDAGFQVHFHALGDRAVREALDAVAVATAHNGTGHNGAGRNGTGDRRHHLAHLQVVHPDDVPRFAALSVAATVQALWACHEPQMDELTIPFLGGDLARHQYPFGDLWRAGATLAAGSDWPVSSPNPWWAAKVAVTRVAAGGEPELAPFLPAQALDLGTFLAAYTAGSAWVNHLDGVTGAIRPGLAADLVVVD